MEEMNLYSQLLAFSESYPHLLVTHKTDLTIHDQAGCKSLQRGEKVVWVLRNSGTQFIPVPAHINWSRYGSFNLIDKIDFLEDNWNLFSYWAEQDKSRGFIYKYFLIECSALSKGTVVLTTIEKAFSLLNPFDSIANLAYLNGVSDRRINAVTKRIDSLPEWVAAYYHKGYSGQKLD